MWSPPKPEMRERRGNMEGNGERLFSLFLLCMCLAAYTNSQGLHRQDLLVPGTKYSPPPRKSSLITTMNHLHFTDEETETKGSYVPCSRPQC